MQGKNILVTGGAGFIGSALVKRFVSGGATVTVFDDFYRGVGENLNSVADQINLITGDICDAAAVHRACEGQHMVCHLAYINGTEYFYSMPDTVLNVAVRGMINIMDGCKAAKVKEFIYASSSEVYQHADVIPTPENVPLVVPSAHNPRYSYGVGKIIGEMLTLHDLQKHLERVVIFRPHNVFGANMGHQHVIPQLVKKIVETSHKNDKNKDLTIELKGDGSQSRAFIHIDQFIDALFHVIQTADNAEIVHIGSEEEITIRELLSRISQIMGLKVTASSSQPPEGETSRRCADVSRLRALGYSDRFDMSKGLEHTVLAYQNYYERNKA